MKSRQGWGRAGVNKGQELKLSGKTNWNQLLPLGSRLWHTYTSPPFLAFSMHGHFLEFRPSISLWMEALPTCPTTNSYCFSWHSRQRLFVRWGACADFAASLNDLVSHRISWLWGDQQGWSRDDLPSYHNHHFVQSATIHELHDYLPESRIGAGFSFLNCFSTNSFKREWCGNTETWKEVSKSRSWVDLTRNIKN